MWYTLGHEKTHLHPCLDRGRTADPAGGVAFVQGLCVASLPDPPGQCPGPDGPCDWRDTGVRRSDRPQCPACLHYPGASGPDAAVLRPPADAACGLRCPAARAVADAAAPESPHLWPSHQSVDLTAGGQGGVCRGADGPADQWGSDPPSAGAPRGTLATGQTLDHQSRSGVHTKKKRRDRLMALARTHPTWALAWEDEVWWSRLAQPALHTWRPDHDPLRLQELTLPCAERTPKALACYGVLVRHVPTQPEQMLLRFVEHRPVSRETTAFLA